MRLGLGTVQFGLNYGVTNTAGQPDRDVCEDILCYAKHSGIKILDTAAGYGISESVLGELDISQDFSVVSKVPTLANCSSQYLRQSIENTLIRLKRDSINGILLHNEQDLLESKADDYFEQLLSLKSEGIVNQIGVSFYSVEAANQIINRYDIDLVQIPANHLDRRFENSNVLELAKSKNIEVHSRSLFLQGLLVSREFERPDKFRSFIELKRFDEQVKLLNVTPLQLAMSYLTQTPDIDYAVVGCTSVEQLKEIVDAYDFCEKEKMKLPNLSTLNTALINPVNW